MISRLLIGISVGACIGGLMGYFGKCTSGACPLTANPYRGALFGAVIGVVLSMSAAVPKKTKNTPSQIKKNNITNETTLPEALVLINNTEDFERIILQATKPSLVDFYSDGCPPCRMLSPTIDKLAEKYQGRAVVSKVNVDAAPELAQTYGIKGIPAVLFFDGGKEVDQLVGLQKQPAYEKVLDALIAKSEETEKEVPDANL